MWLELELLTACFVDFEEGRKWVALRDQSVPDLSGDAFVAIFGVNLKNLERDNLKLVGSSALNCQMTPSYLIARDQPWWQPSNRWRHRKHWRHILHVLHDDDHLQARNVPRVLSWFGIGVLSKKSTH